MWRIWVCLVAVLVLCALVPNALAHPERATFYPDASKGSVPKYRTGGPARVVCKRDSRARINRIYKGSKLRKLRGKTLRQMRECKYHDIQAAVNAARNGDRILIMPGVYRELPSRAKPIDDPKCKDMFEVPEDGDARVATFEHQVKCPNARNLIIVNGDSLADADRECDHKCNIQMEGMGRQPKDVKIVGDRIKTDVIRADRADGFFLRNVWVEQGAFNDVDVVETNGFRLRKLVTPYAQNYGVLSFTSDHGLYDLIEAFNNGDSGVYPGSGPEGHCKRYGIEIRGIDSHDNVLGYSGTAGNGTWTHNSKFHDNNAGISDDSFAAGHPGMPQDCSKWNANQVNSNNQNFFTPDRQGYCSRTPFEKRRKEIVCPQFQVPVGSGFILYGVNENIVQHNAIYDNWRSGVRQFWVPASIRGDNDPAKQFDTSNGNKYLANTMGVGPGGASMPNGVDFFWDEQGLRNCWQGNIAAAGKQITSDPATLPACPTGSLFQQSNGAKSAAEVPCASWDENTNQQPAGFTWFTTPPKPSG
jgi:hypothetical protein